MALTSFSYSAHALICSFKTDSKPKQTHDSYVISKKIRHRGCHCRELKMKSKKAFQKTRKSAQWFPSSQPHYPLELTLGPLPFCCTATVLSLFCRLAHGFWMIMICLMVIHGPKSMSTSASRRALVGTKNLRVGKATLESCTLPSLYEWLWMT